MATMKIKHSTKKKEMGKKKEEKKEHQKLPKKAVSKVIQAQTKKVETLKTDLKKKPSVKVIKAVESQIQFRDGIEKFLESEHHVLHGKTNTQLLKCLLSSLVKIKKQLDKDPHPTKLADRKFIIEHLGRIRIISDIFKERKKHDKKEKLLYIAALSEIKRFFTIFEKLGKDLKKELKKKK